MSRRLSAEKKVNSLRHDLHSNSLGFGSSAFTLSFDLLLLKDSKLGRPKISAAWRVVNNKDVVARLPRTVDGLIFGKIGYEHVGRTVLISGEEGEGAWIEGVSEGGE